MTDETRRKKADDNETRRKKARQAEYMRNYRMRNREYTERERQRCAQYYKDNYEQHPERWGRAPKTRRGPREP